MKAIADARAREYKLDQLVGLPPPAPVVPKASGHARVWATHTEFDRPLNIQSCMLRDAI